MFLVHKSFSSCPGRTNGFCKCWQCGSKSHLGALCPVIKKAEMNTNVCYQDRDQNQDLLLSLINIKVIKNGIKRLILSDRFWESTFLPVERVVGSDWVQ